MANIKFSQFTVETAKADVDFLVGYSGPDNVQISPTNLLADYPAGSGAAGQVTFFSAASTVTGDNDFYWDNTNKRLGVGTTSPDRKFEVASTGTGEMCITGATGSRLYFRPTTQYSGGGNFGILVTGSGGPSYLSTMTITGYNNGLNTVMTLKGDGNVGVGTATPVAKLHVEGSFISSGISQLGTTGANVLLTSSSAGNVGIGTTSPTYKLTIEENAATDAVRILNTDSNGGGLSVYAANGGGGTNRILTLGDSALNIKVAVIESGNVGIGTSSPGVPLDVFGGDGIRTTTNLGALTDGYFAQLRSDYGSNALRLRSRAGDVFRATNFGQAVSILTGSTSSGTSERIRITDTGLVGIGTTTPDTVLEVVNDVDNSSNTALDVNAGIIIHNGNSSGTAVLKLRGSGGNSGAVVFGGGGGAASDKFHIISRHNQTKRLTVQANGNVGIGTTSPASKLEVNGGDIEVDDSASGLILRSPDGTRYRVTVANGGTLSVSAV